MPHYYGHIHQLCSINPKLTYPLVASLINNKQLKSIHNLIHSSVILIKGFNRNWPEGLQYGNQRVEQRLREIQLLHKLLLHPKHKISMQGIIEWYQISAGLIGEILVNPSNQVNYVNCIWFQDLIIFMATSQIKIFTVTFLTSNHQRKNDKTIMVEISKMKLSKQSNIKINTCRPYLQVATLSDITNPDGRSINHHFLEGNKPLPPVLPFRWPNQPFPSPKVWNLCRRMVKKVFNINENNSIPIHQQ